MWRKKRETAEYSAIRRDIYVIFKWLAAAIWFYGHAIKFLFPLLIVILCINGENTTT
jgi:hypothetical protein